jgi:hypothetical protein
MSRPNDLKVALLAAAYVLWLVLWTVFQDETWSPSHHHWDQAFAAALTAVAALVAAWLQPRPWRGFLLLHGLAFGLLAFSWLTYEVIGKTPAAQALSDLHCDSLYALSVFCALCAWSYLALEHWPSRALTPITLVVFTTLMLGLGAVFATFYVTTYESLLGTTQGRLDAATAAIEFALIVAGLLCVLLRMPAMVVRMLVASAVLVAGDMAYSTSPVPPAIDAIWMFGQLLWLSAIVSLRSGGLPLLPSSADLSRRTTPDGRSGLSGLLILLSLGAVLVSPLVWMVPEATAWKAFGSLLFIVSLVVLLVWVTDRFDDTVAYLRAHVRQVMGDQLTLRDWRTAPTRIRDALLSTRLSDLLDEFSAAANRLRQQVIFLGPEPLFGPPRLTAVAGKPSCFIVMPFGQPWSADVHRIVAAACEKAQVRPVRGDDLFTPTDILEDIWQSMQSAAFIVADITGRNPNVLYELGMAHTLAKPVLILSRNASDIPIDLATRRVLLYGQAGDDFQDDLAAKMDKAMATLVQTYGAQKPG